MSIAKTRKSLTNRYFAMRDLTTLANHTVTHAAIVATRGRTAAN